MKEPLKFKSLSSRERKQGSSVDHSVSFPQQFNLAQYFLFDRLREGEESKVAVRYGPRDYSYGDIAERVRSLVGYFQSIGVQSGERVHIVLPDMPPFVWTLFAVLARGAVVVMGNPYGNKHVLARQWEYIQPTVVVTLASLAAELRESLAAIPGLRAVLVVPDGGSDEDPELQEPVPQIVYQAPFRSVLLAQAVALGRLRDSHLAATHRDDVCFWLLSSGSTGEPKAAMHTHRDFAFSAEVYAKRTMGFCRQDVTLSIPKLFFGYATGTNLLFPFAVGATVVLLSERSTVATISDALSRYRPTILTSVPTILERFVEASETQQRHLEAGLRHVRYILSAGEPLPLVLLQRFTERFARPVYDGLGSAEMFHIYVSNHPGGGRQGSLGRPVDGYEIRILPPEARGPGAAEVASQEAGVLWVKGDSVATGYFRDRDASWRTFFGHWCCTGDLVRRDEDGYLWFVGRVDQRVKVAGQWVVPAQIEKCLRMHPSVQAAVVVPKPHAELVRIAAFVVARKQQPISSSQLKRHVRHVMPSYCCPEEFHFVAELPMNERGKIDRRALMERMTGG